MAISLGRLQKVELRDIWHSESRDFTSWLSENLDLLGEILNIRLSLLEQEGNVGPFAVDIIAADENSGTVIIENQLDKTDHDHLGKVLTYMINLGAKTAIWVTSDSRPEHAKVVDWLNEVTPPDTSIYLVRIEAYRIENSPPAPAFVVVAGPSEEGKATGRAREEMAERYKLRLEFWDQLLAKAKSKSKLHAGVSPTKDNWLGAGAGKTGFSWVYVITMDWAAAELYINRGPDTTAENKRIFDELYAKKEAIERNFGGQLIWDRLDDRRACRIRAKIDLGGLKNQDKWPQIQEAMVDVMVRLSSALQHEIKDIW